MLLQITLTGATPTSNALTFSVSGLPPGATFNSSTRQFSWRPAPNQGGAVSFAQGGPASATYGVTITVTDGVMTATKTITLTVNNTITDTDLDGFPDVATGSYPADNCPTVFNPNQANFDMAE